MIFHRPYHAIKEHAFVDADTGEVRERFQMREFYEWDSKAANGPSYVLVRHYQLDKETELNPNREGLSS